MSDYIEVDGLRVGPCVWRSKVEEVERLQARVAELESMGRAFRACVDLQMPPSMEGRGMSDSREAFEQIYSIPTGAEWCEKRHIYIHKNYSGLVLHPINESWEAFCEGALWQASREAISSCSEIPNSSEAAAWSWENHGRQVTVDKAFADELISDGEIVRPLIFGDTHPASAAPDEEYLRALQDAFDIIQADANTEENYGSLCRIGSVLGKLKDTPTNADVWIKCSDRLPTEDAGTDLDMSVTIGTFQR